MPEDEVEKPNIERKDQCGGCRMTILRPQTRKAGVRMEEVLLSFVQWFTCIVAVASVGSLAPQTLV